jgi:hypothetical protein
MGIRRRSLNICIENLAKLLRQLPEIIVTEPGIDDGERLGGRGVGRDAGRKHPHLSIPAGVALDVSQQLLAHENERDDEAELNALGAAIILEPFKDAHEQIVIDKESPLRVRLGRRGPPEAKQAGWMRALPPRIERIIQPDQGRTVIRFGLAERGDAGLAGR